MLHCLRLLRPANIVTSFADILAGSSLMYVATSSLGYDLPANPVMSIVLLLVATAGLYGGGVVLNDVFDANLDAVERPERPIPSGKIKKSAALSLGIICLVVGILSALLVNIVSFILAVTIALLAVTYDGFTKPMMVAGPVNMALCRMLNLMLGISVSLSVLKMFWPLGFIHFFYILGVTLISKGEVNGSSRNLLFCGLVLYVLPFIVLISLFWQLNLDLFYPAVFLFGMALLVFPPLFKALFSMSASDIRKSVKFGILGLIILDSAILSGTLGPWFGIAMLMLLPISFLLGRWFAIT